MTYALVDVVFLALAAALSGAALARRPPRGRTEPVTRRPRRAGRPRAVRGFWRPALAGGAVLVLLTAVFDSVMISAGLFGYRPDALSGAFVGLAPIEDFAYPIAAFVLLPALWRRMRGNDPEARP